MSLKNNVVLSPREQLFFLRLPHGLRGTWMLWRMGMDPYHHMARQTFYRHAEQLEKYNVLIRGRNPHATSVEEDDAPKGHVDESFYKRIGKPLPQQYEEAKKRVEPKGKTQQQMTFLELDK